MERYFITKDSKVVASTATRDDAIDLIRAYQQRETHPFLKAEFSIIHGTEELVPYEKTK